MAFTLILALAVNSAVVERYYLHRQSRYLRGVGEQLERYLSEGMSPETVIERLEAEEKVLIVYSERAVDSRPNHTPQGDLDSEALSSELREKFRGTVNMRNATRVLSGTGRYLPWTKRHPMHPPFTC